MKMHQGWAAVLPSRISLRLWGLRSAKGILGYTEKKDR
jgi:hypothetical protein